jgi:hypothetical protein
MIFLGVCIDSKVWHFLDGTRFIKSPRVFFGSRKEPVLVDLPDADKAVGSLVPLHTVELVLIDIVPFHLEPRLVQLKVP